MEKFTLSICLIKGELQMLDSILSPDSGLTFSQIALCTFTAIILGILVAYIYMYKNTYNKNFVVTLALLPVMIQAVIMLVNGNLGTGVAVLGAFSLVRFRSAPGSARDIISIFFTMAIGLSVGMGYIIFAAMFTVFISLMMIIYLTFPFAEGNQNIKSLIVVLPENIDYVDLFDDIFSEFTKKATLERVKTINMGSLFELNYTITLKDKANEKNFIDKIRCRNGNLSIVCGRYIQGKDEL